MKSAVLADTGPLYALADASDQFHNRAHSELQEIEKRGLAIAASYPVLCEAHALIRRRLGGLYASQWLQEMFEGAVLLNPAPADYLLAAKQLETFRDHPITLVDVVTAMMSRRLDLPVWSFDRHFAVMRTAVWRS